MIEAINILVLWVAVMFLGYWNKDSDKDNFELYRANHEVFREIYNNQDKMLNEIEQLKLKISELEGEK